jgi:pimeloyl-ACP methyl ester carboxylesterase
MLPGAGFKVDEFAEQGFVGAVLDLGLPIDIVAARPDLDHYLDGSLAVELHRAIIEPALLKGYTRLWLLGISMGGMGALLYTSAYSVHVAGIFLLSPFLGTRGTIAEIATAGGLTSWSAVESAASVAERQMLIWLQDYLSRRPMQHPLYLGYGQADRFARGHRLLADLLPPSCVITVEGGHNWLSWSLLFRRMLDISPFTEDELDWTR